MNAGCGSSLASPNLRQLVRNAGAGIRRIGELTRGRVSGFARARKNRGSRVAGEGTADRRRGHKRDTSGDTCSVQSLLNIHPAASFHSKLTKGHLNKSTNCFSALGIPNERGDDRRRRPRNGIYFRLCRSELICSLQAALTRRPNLSGGESSTPVNFNMSPFGC